LSQTPAQRNPIVLAGFVLVVTAILGAAAYGLNTVTNPRPVATTSSLPAICNPAPAGHPRANPARNYSAPPPLTIDTTKQYTATMCTDRGLVVFNLRKSTPQTTNNFVNLVNNGFYDGLSFHRVCPNTADSSCGDGSLKIAQGGDPKGDGTGGPGYSLPDEGTKGPYSGGTFAMARAQQISGSQFFIDTADNSSILSPQPNVYNVFGDITSGLDVAQKLQKGDRMYWVSIDAGPAASQSPSAAAPAASPGTSAPAPSPS